MLNVAAPKLLLLPLHNPGVRWAMRRLSCVSALLLLLLPGRLLHLLLPLAWLSLLHTILLPMLLHQLHLFLSFQQPSHLRPF